MPAPTIPKAIGRYLFDQIRDLTTIATYLETAYARKEAFDEELMHQIRACTVGAGGHAAFASILWSPPLQISDTSKGTFQECLTRLKCDVLLIFGKDDPWCKPAFAKKMLQALEEQQQDRESSSHDDDDRRGVHRYVEIENCGHCPNHEAPQAVAKVVHAWVSAKDRARHRLSLVDGDGETFMEPWGKTIAKERQEQDIVLSWMDRVATTFV